MLLRPTLFKALAGLIAGAFVRMCTRGRTLQELLTLDPGNRQAADLQAAVEHVLRRDGAAGIAILSAAAVAAFAVGAAVLKRR